MWYVKIVGGEIKAGMVRVIFTHNCVVFFACMHETW